MATIAANDEGREAGRFPEFSARMHWATGPGEQRDVAVLEVAGSLCADTAERLRQALYPAGEWRFVVLEAAGVTSLDAVGLAVIVHAAQSARAGGGALRLACAGEPVSDTLSRTGLDRYLPAHASVFEAMQSFG
jgi:anti-sigma B factor antagonist